MENLTLISMSNNLGKKSYVWSEGASYYGKIMVAVFIPKKVKGIFSISLNI